MRLLLAIGIGIGTGYYVIKKTKALDSISKPSSTALGIGSGLFGGALSYWMIGAIVDK